MSFRILPWRKNGSTQDEVGGVRQPTNVVLELGAPNQCSVVPPWEGDAPAEPRASAA